MALITKQDASADSRGALDGASALLLPGWLRRGTLDSLEWNVNAGRNDPCPCGSGRKYKACCGRLASAPPDEIPLADELARLGALLDAQRYPDLESEARELLERKPASGI